MRPQLLFARGTLACALLVATAGCTTAGDSDSRLRSEAATRAGLEAATVDAADAPAIAARVEELLATELGREEAVTLTLLNNPALAARLAGLRIDAADRLRAARPPNPSLTLGRFERGAERETERGVGIDLVGLLAWPATRGIANRQYEAARHDALDAALALARDTRTAWIEAVAAGAAEQHAQAVLDAADTGRLYAERLTAAGNASALDSARAQAFHAEAAIALARARTATLAARERLLVLLGLADDRRLQLPAGLPALPDTPTALARSEQAALDGRVDVQAARRQYEATARALRLKRITGVVNVLEAGYHVNSDNTAPEDQHGVEVTLELPLFDLGAAGRGEARARHDAAVAGVAATAVRARSEVRQAWQRYDTAWTIARRYRDEVLPLTAQVTREMILRHNGMLVGPFELLAQAREQAGATARWQEARRDFWLAEAELAAALVGGSGNAAGRTAPAANNPAPAPAGGH